MEENKTKQRIIDIKPVTKWKRILIFLGDFFITFLLGLILYNVAGFPLTNVITGASEKSKLSETKLQESTDMLIESGFLYYAPEVENKPKTFENAVAYTFDVFISYYLYDVETPLQTNPQLGHKIENEVIRTYYINHKKDPAKYLEIWTTENKIDNFFNVGDSIDSIAIKPEFKESLKLQFEEKKDGKYSEQLTLIKDNIFGRLFYLGVYLDIETNDLIIGEKSYKTLLNQVKTINKELDWAVSVGAIIVAFVSSSIVYLIFPLIHKENRTPTMHILKIDKLNIFNLNYVKKKNVLLGYILNFILSLGGVLFYPVMQFGIAYCFNLPLLFVFLLISVALMLISCGIIIFNQYNRSGSDLLSFSVLVPTSELDKMYVTEDYIDE